MKELTFKITIREEDFCLLDLKEALIDGLDNVGNYTLIKVEEVEE